MMDMHYKIIDGNYRLFDGDEDLNCVNAEMVAVGFDRDSGTLHKHGSPESIHEWAEKTRGKYRAAGFADMANDLVVMSGRFPVDELNKCISTSGYCKILYEKLGKLEQASEAVEQSEPRGCSM